MKKNNFKFEHFSFLKTSLFVFSLLASSLLMAQQTAAAQKQSSSSDKEAAYQAYLDDLASFNGLDSALPFDSDEWTHYGDDEKVISIPALLNKKPSDKKPGKPSGNGLQKNSCPNEFYDGFESGSYLPTWTEVDNGYTRTVNTADPAAGDYSLRQTGIGVGGHYDGLRGSFAPSQPTEMSWWVKPETSDRNHNYIVVGDAGIGHNNDGVLFNYYSGNKLRFFSNSIINVAINLGTWYFIEVKDMDWVNKHMDIYIDGILIQADFPFRSQSSTYVDRVHLYNFNSGTANYDDISIGCLPAPCPDADNDGYLDATCGGDDCDDNDASVHPGATEVCNGIDDDCNGTVDDGAAATYTGNIAFTSQAQVDAFLSCYTTINGSVTVQGAGIFSLAALSNVEEITGNLTIQYAGMFNLAGLDNLHTVGGTVTIYYNFILGSLFGLDNLSSVGGSFWTYYNFNLSDCCAVMGLINGGVGGNVSIFFNKTGCNSVAEINNNCEPGQLLIAPSGGNDAPLSPAISNQNKLSERQLEVFPNPNNGQFTVRLTGLASSGEIALCNTSGQVVWKKGIETGGGTLEIGLQDGIAPGCYLLRFKGNEDVMVKKVIIK